ncbi:hypothetical protein ACLOJK_031211 [Asimina triloba]
MAVVVGVETTSERNFPESNQEKRKAPSASQEAGAIWTRAKRAPTNADKLNQVLKVVDDLTTYVMKIEKKQASQDAEIASLHYRNSTETLATLLGKRSIEIPMEVLEQIRREAMIPQPVPQRQIKMMANKKAVYSKPDEDTESTEENPAQKKGRRKDT